MRVVSGEYETQEQATTKRPSEIFRFWIAGGSEWRYTNADQSITYGGKTYTPAPISRGAVSHEEQPDAPSLSIQMARVAQPLIQYIAGNPIETVWVEVRRVHRGTSPLTSDQIFFGTVSAPSIQGQAVEAKCLGFGSFLQVPIPRFRFQRTCNNYFYDDYCGISKTTYAETVNLDTVSDDGLELTDTQFGTHSDGYYTRGYVVSGEYKRMVVNHEGSTIDLRFTIPGLAAGSEITIYRGCPRDYETCRDTFSNEDNFLGCPFIPLDNPVTWMGR